MTSFLDMLRTQRWDDHRYYHHSQHQPGASPVERDQFRVCLPPWSSSIRPSPPRCSRGLARRHDQPPDAGISGLRAEATTTSGQRGDAMTTRKKSRSATISTARSCSCPFGRLSPLLLCRGARPLFGIFQRRVREDRDVRPTTSPTHVAGGRRGRTAVPHGASLLHRQTRKPASAWMTKIVTDPFHDISLYYKAPLHLIARLN